MNTKLNKNKITFLGAVCLCVASFAAGRLISMLAQPEGKEFVIIALIFTLMLGVVCILISKIENAFLGIFAALIGYKMMPPDISGMSNDTDSGMLYFVVKNAAVLIFIMLIYKFYKMQEEKNKISILTILLAMAAVTFANSFSSQTLDYFLQKTGSKLGYYFTGFICYILASMVILIVSYCSNYESMRFAAYYEFTVLGINIAKRGVVIAINLANSQHISNSYYCWIVIYAAIIAVFYIAKNKKKKEITSDSMSKVG